MIIRCENERLFTLSDLISGKIIGYRGITLSALLILISGLLYSTVFNYLAFDIAALTSCLILVIAATIAFLMRDKNGKKSSHLLFKNGQLILFKNGKPTTTEHIQNLTIELASWTDEENRLMPALQIEGNNLGKIRIGVKQEDLSWIHFKKIFSKTHYIIDDPAQWDQLKTFLN